MTEFNWTTELPRRIEHTLLAQEADEAAIGRLCAEAKQFGFFGVCVNPVWVKTAFDLCQGTGIQVVSVVGFPLGASRTELKVAEAARAAEDGANEIDMVVNVGWLISGQADRVTEEIRKVRRNLPTEVILKVIIEAGKLSTEQLKLGVDCVVAGGAEFVKTSTGMYAPATVEQVRQLVAASAGRVKVKAAGGIQTLLVAREMIGAGADRLGMSSSVRIMAELIVGSHG